MPTITNSSTKFVCKKCGHDVRNHFAERSPIRKHCAEKDCECDWAWDGDCTTRMVQVVREIESSHVPAAIPQLAPQVKEHKHPL
jgi:hypothetical protein